MNVNTPIDYLFRYTFGHFCSRVKHRKRLSEFHVWISKYTDSGTKTTHLAGYNILVFKYAKNLCGSASTFYRGNSRKKLKIRYCIIWRCLHLMFSTTNVSDKWNVRGFERMLSYEQYPEEKSRLWLSSFKKQLINLHGGQLDVTTNIYLKSCANHPDSGCCAFFHGNLLFEVGWSTRNYPHTGHLS